MVWSWLGSLCVLIAAWLLLDAAAGFAEWRGLRSTRLAPGFVLVLGTGSLVAAVLMLRVSTAPPVLPLLGLVAAPLVHTGVASLVGRKMLPNAWSAAGTYPTHRVTDVAIPTDDEPVPALWYEPLSPPVGAMLLIHGAGAHKSFYTWPMIEALLRSGFAVCAIDLAGHGDSKRVLDIRTALEDVHASVAWLRARASWVGVIGISLGGCVAARAVAEGLQLDGLAIMAAPTTVTVNKRVVRNEYRTIGRRGTWALHRYAGTLPLLRAWRTEPTRSRIGTLDLIRDLDLPGSIGRLDGPLWLCYGSADLVAPLDDARRLIADAPAATTSLIVPRATHLSLPLDRRALDGLCHWLLAQQASSAMTVGAGMKSDARIAIKR